MNRSKKISPQILLFSVIIVIELILIIVFSILTISTNTESNLSDNAEVFEYCQTDDFDSEICDAYYDELTAEYDTHYVDPEIYGETFLSTYAAIKAGKPVPLEYFDSFVTLSEYYNDEHLTGYISGENNPVTYYASTSHHQDDVNDIYPYNVTRHIFIDIPEEGCAKFDFSPNFSFLYSYSLEDDNCNESI